MTLRSWASEVSASGNLNNVHSCTDMDFNSSWKKNKRHFIFITSKATLQQQCHKKNNGFFFYLIVVSNFKHQHFLKRCKIPLCAKVFSLAYGNYVRLIFLKLWDLLISVFDHQNMKRKKKPFKGELQYVRNSDLQQYS